MPLAVAVIRRCVSGYTAADLMQRLLLALFAALPLAAQAAEPAPSAIDQLRQRVAGGLTELGQWAFEQQLFAECSSVARLARRVVESASTTYTQGLAKLDVDGFGILYRRARQKSGPEFDKRRDKVVKPAAKEFVQLAKQAEEAGDEPTAEAGYLLAHQLDGRADAATALRKRDFDVVFNYGAIPRAEKQAVRKHLRTLGGKLFEEADLKPELKFWRDAWGLQTKHYRFVTDAPHGTVFAFAQACEDLHDAWEPMMQQAGFPLRPLSKPATVYLFNSPVAYQIICRLGGEDPPADTLGFYSPQSRVGYFYDDPEFYEGSLGLLFETFYHEGTHQLLDHRMKAGRRGDIAKHPLVWVEEGFCVYMETMVVTEEGDKRIKTFGREIDDDWGMGLAGLARDQLKPLDKFVHMNRQVWDDYDASYPHAALVMHYMLESGEPELRAKGFALLREEITQGGLRKAPFFEWLGRPVAEFEAGLKAFSERSAKDLKVRTYKKK